MDREDRARLKSFVLTAQAVNPDTYHRTLRFLLARDAIGAVEVRFIKVALGPRRRPVTPSSPAWKKIISKGVSDEAQALLRAVLDPAD